MAFQGHCELKLLNQKRDDEHDYGGLIYSDDTPDCYTSRLMEDERSIHGWGFYKFISNEELHEITSTRQYVKDDCIFFRETKV